MSFFIFLKGFKQVVAAIVKGKQGAKAYNAKRYGKNYWCREEKGKQAGDGDGGHAVLFGKGS